MSTSLAKQPSATERRSLADVCGKPIKADLHPQVPASDLRGAAAEARSRAVKLESAADDIGIHPSRLSHKFADGSLRLSELEKLGPKFALEFGKELVERHGPLSDPKDHARKLCDAIQAQVNELRQFIDQE